ncbi:MAG: peptidoglycan-associated lipoprotein Pal [Gammaproteobacteria bacterium]|nr:peptidoglycan-associated lipoprotein Pal [Gammaproteobacteria bacterium]
MQTMKVSVGRIVAVLAVVVLAGCETGSGVKDEGTMAPAAVEDRTTAGGQDLQGGQGIESQGQWQGNPIDDPNSLLSTRIIYFDYDQSEVRPGDRDIVEAHGAYLAQNPNVRVVLEAHADERGTREYNIALSERRGRAVRQLMTLLAANPGQIEVVGYGEERPAVLGSDESAWSQNRRVEIVYGVQ